MPSLGQFFGALIGFSNQNNASAGLIGNVNVDFTLFRFEAPREYAPFGSALSLARRQEAEEGSTHRTARRLAALFEQKIPSAPKLMSAYGQRVSEIMKIPEVNPGPSQHDGPFAPCVGADGTAIWAAATSGTGALGVCLLALLLARAWDSTDATSIWDEIVKAQREEILEGYTNNRVVSEASLVSTLQNISREDLRLWDASARSWLQSADQGMPWQLKQFELTTRDFRVPSGGGSTTFEKVISAWKNAMTCIENLLENKPQEISDAAVLYAISAWHLFPKLLVLRGNTLVDFHDKLFEGRGVGTIGLESTLSTEGGIRWSLALSHLEYYGEPVEVESQLDTPRVTIDQFRLVVLGAVFKKWKINHRDFQLTALWIVDLWSLLSDDQEAPNLGSATLCLNWLYPIVQGSQKLLSAAKESAAALSDAERLINYGQRRGDNFLGGQKFEFAPFFGLCDVHVLAGLGEIDEAECAVAFLRSVAALSGLEARDGFIMLCHGDRDYERHIGGAPDVIEYITIAPSNSSANQPGTHVRWSNRGAMGTPANGALFDKEIDQLVDARRSIALARGEEFHTLPGPQRPLSTIGHTTEGSVLKWPNPPLMFRDRGPENLRQRLYNGSGPPPKKRARLEDSAERISSDSDFLNFNFVYGSWRCGMYLRTDRVSSKTVEWVLNDRQRCDAQQAMKLLKQEVNTTALLKYICGFSTSFCRREWSPGWGISLLTRQHEMHEVIYRSLCGLSAAGHVFVQIKAPTISLETMSRPFQEAQWAQGILALSMDDPIRCSETDLLFIGEFCASRINKPAVRSPRELTRAESFACVVYLDSGHIDLNPEHLDKVLAVSTGNSIYVASIVLSDPSSPVVEHDILRIAGNIGRAGVSLLVAPQNPKIRNLNHDYRLVTHAAYDSKRENNFTRTSMHLSFTSWELPLNTGGTRTIDKEVNYIESVISVHEDGVWVADLDIMEIDFHWLQTNSLQEQCLKEHEDSLEYDFTSVDSWEELLDAPNSIGVFRAHGNWAARLAAVSILSQKGLGHAIRLFETGQTHVCLKCLEMHLIYRTLHFGSGLPIFCID